MSNQYSDALVFFGATGNLAYKKIFPALQGMVKRGHLTVPVIGVAKAGWNLDQFKARASVSMRAKPALHRRLHLSFSLSAEYNETKPQTGELTDQKMTSNIIRLPLPSMRRSNNLCCPRNAFHSIRRNSPLFDKLSIELWAPNACAAQLGISRDRLRYRLKKLEEGQGVLAADNEA